MSELLQLRCSALPRGFLCPGSVREPTLKIRVTSDPAELGTDAHDHLARVDEPGFSPEDITDRDLRALVALGARMWRKLRSNFPDPIREHQMRHEFPEHGFVLTGKSDILSVSLRSNAVADWKSGRTDEDHSPQIFGYMLLASCANPRAEMATGTLLWVRDEEVENYTASVAELLVFAGRIRDRIVNWDGTYYPGYHCGFCPRYHECDARVAHDRAALVAFSPVGDVARDLSELPTERKLQLYQMSGVVERLAKTLRDSLRQEVIDCGPLDDGKHRLRVVDDPHYTIHPLEAWAVMDEFGLDDDAKAAVIKISKSALEERVGQDAPYRGKAKRIRELREALTQANAISVETGKRLQFGRSERK